MQSLMGGYMMKEWVDFFLFVYKWFTYKMERLYYETQFTCLHKYIRIHNSD